MARMSDLVIRSNTSARTGTDGVGPTDEIRPARRRNSRPADVCNLGERARDGSQQHLGHAGIAAAGVRHVRKLYLRILRPNWAALLPDEDRLPRPLRAALEQLDHEIAKLYEEAAFAA